MLKEAYGVKRIIMKTGKTDLRYGIDRLASMVRLEYGLDPLDEGTLFLFCGNKKDRVKALVYEGDGYTLLTKKLSRGVFQWPQSVSEAREMSRDDYRNLMDGYVVESAVKTYKSLGQMGSDPRKALEMQGAGGCERRRKALQKYHINVTLYFTYRCSVIY